MWRVPHVSQGRGPDGINHTGMATNKPLGEWNTKSTTGRLETEVPILSVGVNDIRTVEYNTETVSESASRSINRNRTIQCFGIDTYQ